jgi:hypothetical protein
MQLYKLQIKPPRKTMAEQAGERARKTPEPEIEHKERESGAEPAASTDGATRPADERDVGEREREHPLTQKGPTDDEETERQTKRPEDA